MDAHIQVYVYMNMYTVSTHARMCVFCMHTCCMHTLPDSAASCTHAMAISHQTLPLPSLPSPVRGHPQSCLASCVWNPFSWSYWRGRWSSGHSVYLRAWGPSGVLRGAKPHLRRQGNRLSRRKHLTLTSCLGNPLPW